jgi:hypothetical protein
MVNPKIVKIDVLGSGLTIGRTDDCYWNGCSRTLASASASLGPTWPYSDPLGLNHHQVAKLSQSQEISQAIPASRLILVKACAEVLRQDSLTRRDRRGTLSASTVVPTLVEYHVSGWS